MKNILSFLVRKVADFGRWVAGIPYRQLLLKLLHAIGNGLHWLIFDLLLPKRLRGITKKEIFTIIFRADTPAGKKFDVWLLILIVLNLFVLVLDSFETLHEGTFSFWLLKVAEWGFTIIFTLEYYLRIYCLKRPSKYIFSFYGVIDFLSIFPAYLSLLFPATQTLTVLRLLRMLRIFRIFKMERFMDESRHLLNSIRRSMIKVSIFMLFVFIVAVILGALLFAVEGEKNPAISSIPQGIYWAVVTITTVGYGDVAPVTPLGRFIAMVVMILGYSIIAVPTGIVAGETIEEHRLEHRRKQQHEPDEERENGGIKN